MADTLEHTLQSDRDLDRLRRQIQALGVLCESGFEMQTPAQLRELAAATLARTDFWGQDLGALPGFVDVIASGLEKIATRGMRAAIGRSRGRLR